MANNLEIVTVISTPVFKKYVFCIYFKLINNPRIINDPLHVIHLHPKLLGWIVYVLKLRYSRFKYSGYPIIHVAFCHCQNIKNILVYSAWGSYSDCSATCGNGEKTKIRTCIGGTCSLATSSDLIQTEICNEGDCKLYKVPFVTTWIIFQKKNNCWVKSELI